jgi:hypothetical protein
MWAQDHVRKALGLAGARVLESGVAVAQAAERFSEGGMLTDADTRVQLEQLLAELSEYGFVLLAA